MPGIWSLANPKALAGHGHVYLSKYGTPNGCCALGFPLNQPEKATQRKHVDILISPVSTGMVFENSS